MKDTLTIAIAQINVTVGDLAGNQGKIRKAYQTACKEDCDIIVFPELCITGYPPEDLVLRPKFQDDAIKAIETLAEETQNAETAIIIGGLSKGNQKQIYNTAFVLQAGAISQQILKHHLPNYGVFDEKRIFTRGSLPEIIEVHGRKLGILVCEDTWQRNVAKHLKSQGAELLLSINASPFSTAKHAKRLSVVKQRCKDTALPVIYTNLCGGQDELVFEGHSFAMDKSGRIAYQCPAFEETINAVSYNFNSNTYIKCPKNQPTSKDELPLIYEALKVGLKDYVDKNGFPGVVIGFSGGIDSALSGAIAVDALGSERVHAIMMPSTYTSQESLDDATECAKLLGLTLDEIGITPMVEAFNDALAQSFTGTKTDITEENIQSRIRGLLLMAYSNKFGHMVLTTGNKSEMAVGYATLYGDMCGGFNVLKDLYKTQVFAISKWRNQQGMAIPENVINKPPSAELRLDQKDTDSLPNYDILDAVLVQLIEQRKGSDAIDVTGISESEVRRIAHLVKRAEYKRYQSPPGVKITKLAFGRDRRYPLTHKFQF